MVLISLAPFPLKRAFALTLALLTFSTVTSFATPLLLSVKRTPYDRQMVRIQPILSTPAATNHRDVSLLAVNHWIWELRLIPYRFSMEWKTPDWAVALKSAAGTEHPAISMSNQGARANNPRYGRRRVWLIRGIAELWRQDSETCPTSSSEIPGQSTHHWSGLGSKHSW